VFTETIVPVASCLHYANVVLVMVYKSDCANSESGRQILMDT